MVRGSLAWHPHACGARRAVLPDLRAKPSNVSSGHGSAGRLDHPLGRPRPAFVKDACDGPVGSDRRGSSRLVRAAGSVAKVRDAAASRCRGPDWVHTLRTVSPTRLGSRSGRGTVTPDSCRAQSLPRRRGSHGHKTQRGVLAPRQRKIPISAVGPETHRDAGRMVFSVVHIDQQPPTETAGVRNGATRDVARGCCLAHGLTDAISWLEGGEPLLGGGARVGPVDLVYCDAADAVETIEFGRPGQRPQVSPPTSNS